MGTSRFLARRFTNVSLCTILSVAAPAPSAAQNCSQPVSQGPQPTATDCLLILKTAVGSATCEPLCVCAPKGTLPPTATDALICLRRATGQPVSLSCNCEAGTSTSIPSPSTTTVPAPTTTTLSTTSTLPLATTTTTVATTTTTLAAACNGGTELASVAGITAAHNEVRANASPTPEPALAPLCWSSSVAEIAQAYAEGCVFQHNPSRGFLGENLFASSGSASASSALQAVNLWAAEAVDYTYETNSCSGVCGHYTQLVWRGTENLGCGIATCFANSPFGSSFSTWTFVVCNYDPPGNWVGQLPY